MPRGGLRPCTRSIHWPDRSARAAKFLGAASHCVSKRPALRRFAADNPAHSRIVTQALGVVHILVSGKATKYRLPEQPGQCVPTILATACVGQNITRHLGQTEYVVEFAISQQPSIGGHHGAAKLEHQAAPAEQHPIPIHPLGAPWSPRSIQGKMLIAISESRRPRRNSVRYLVNAGLVVAERLL